MSICLVFKWLGCLVFKWHSNIRPFGIQPLFHYLNTKKLVIQIPIVVPVFCYLPYVWNGSVRCEQDPCVPSLFSALIRDKAHVLRYENLLLCQCCFFPNKISQSRRRVKIVYTVGIRLSALQLPETSSYRTFTSPLTEWSHDKADHSVNRFFVP